MKGSDKSPKVKDKDVRPPTASPPFCTTPVPSQAMPPLAALKDNKCVPLLGSFLLSIFYFSVRNLSNALSNNILIEHYLI